LYNVEISRDRVFQLFSLLALSLSLALPLALILLPFAPVFLDLGRSPIHHEDH